MVGVFVVCIVLFLIIGFVILFFGKYFDINECNVGLVNFILGFIYIIEGVILFVVKDFLKVLLIMMFGFLIVVVLMYMFGV